MRYNDGTILGLWRDGMYRDLTRGSIARSLILFALPMMAGNLLQQFYNIADTLVVGRALGSGALAAVGSAYTLMTFLTSIFLGLSMGSGAMFSMCHGRNEPERLKAGVAHAFTLIAVVTVGINLLVYLFLDPILSFLRVEQAVWDGMREYLLIIFAGIVATSLYNFFSCLLRALGNSVVPLVFLAVSALLNVGLDLLFVLVFHWGIGGAAWATVIAQYVSGVGILFYALKKCRNLLPERRHFRFDRDVLREIVNLSSLTCVQQSVMNFGILMVQGLVNSFGVTVMAAFAAAVKIDTFAYLPVQDFGNAYSTFVAQNFGAGAADRIRRGTREAFAISIAFSLAISAAVFALAEPLMGMFIDAGETAVILSGVRYLRIEGAFYCGIGCLFMLYGYSRAINRPGMSVVLTAISLGTRVLLAYILSSFIGETGIWMAIPIGWILADAVGLFFMRRTMRAANGGQALNRVA